MGGVRSAGDLPDSREQQSFQQDDEVEEQHATHMMLSRAIAAKARGVSALPPEATITWPSPAPDHP